MSRLLLARWSLGLLAAAAAAALFGALAGADALGLYDRSSGAGSVGEATRIFLTNLVVLSVIGLAGGLLAVGWLIEGTEGSLPRAIVVAADVVLIALAVAHALALGLVLGALGWAAARRVIPHAPLELGAFALVFYAYLVSRDRALAHVRMASLYLAGVVLLAGGALVESFLSGAL